MRNYQKLTAAIVCTALSFAVVEAKPAKAVTITYDFDVTVPSSQPFAGVYSGSFSFDNSTPQTLGNVQDFEFNFRGFTFLGPEAGAGVFDGAYWGDEPTASFSSDGELISFNGDFITCVFGNPCEAPGEADYISFENTSFQYEFDNYANQRTSFGVVSYTLSSPKSVSVPETGSVTAVLLSSLGLLLKKRKYSPKSPKPAKPLS